MKVKTLTSLVLLFMSISSMAQNLKEIVAIVRPSYSENDKTYFLDMAAEFERQGFFPSAREFRSLEKGGFGSGFLCKDKNGKTYLMTNKHVVHSAKEVNLEFSINGASVIYSRCIVSRISKDYDLALVELPSDAKFENYLEITSAPIKDGDNVWSAGYPVFKEEPLWQLGKGIISNSTVKNEDFGDVHSISVIQHTAQVDPGSSGGPLMISEVNDKNETTYKVVGINTWKVMRRENANYAVNANDMLEFLNNETLEEKADDATLESRSKEFLKACKSSYSDIIPFISNDFLMSFTPKFFSGILSSASDDAKEKATTLFRERKPFDGMRILLADAIYRSIKKKELFEYNKVTMGTENSSTVNFSYKGETINSTWKVNNGTWELVSFSTINIEEYKKLSIKSGIYIVDEDWAAVSFRLSVPVSEYAGNLYGVTLESRWYTLGLAQLSVYGGKIGIKGDLGPKDNSFTFCDIKMGLSVPIGINQYVITPYALAGLGGGIVSYEIITEEYDDEFDYEEEDGVETNFEFNASVTAGIRFGWRYREDKQLFIGIDYSGQSSLIIDFDTYKTRRSHIGLSLGLNF